MTTRNFRVHNGISVGDIVIDASANTITGGSTAAPSADGQFANKKYVDDGLAGLSQNSISLLNTSVTVTDTGNNGAITFAADGNTELVINDTASTFSGNVVVTGNMTVNGTTTTVSSTNTTHADPLIELNPGAGSNANDLGFVFERGSTGDNAAIIWDESADKFALGTTTATGSSTGDLTLTDANLKAGTVTYASLSDGAITITAFVDEDNMASDSATLVPTQQSVKAYVDSQVVAQDDGIIRATATADSSTTVFTIGTIPSVGGRNYFANKAVIKVTTPWSGGSVDGFKITDDESSETTFVTAVQADPTVAGTYVLDLGMEALVSGTTLQLDVVCRCHYRVVFLYTLAL